MPADPETRTLPADLKQKWRVRFEFFDSYGPLNQPGAKAAFKQLPFGRKMLINFSWLGFFFGGIYWLILGMWRRAVIWFAIVFADILVEILFTAFTGIEVPTAISTAITFVINMITGQATNYAYYQMMVKGDDGWNPFGGLRL